MSCAHSTVRDHAVATLDRGFESFCSPHCCDAEVGLRGDNSLDSTVVGTHYIAYLVANLALNGGPQAAADHNRTPLATVYSALAFYFDNEAASMKRSAKRVNSASSWVPALRNLLDGERPAL